MLERWFVEKNISNFREVISLDLSRLRSDNPINLPAPMHHDSLHNSLIHHQSLNPPQPSRHPQGEVHATHE